MKIKVTILSLVLISATMALAVLTLPFPGWDKIKEISPDIIVAYCSRTPDPEKDRGAGSFGALIYSDIKVISILKATTSRENREPLDLPQLGSARMNSEYYPQQGEYYLVFSIYSHKEYQAIEDYRVIPLGVDFSTNLIVSRPLDEQLKILFKRRLDNLNREIQSDEEEKARLEEGLQK